MERRLLPIKLDSYKPLREVVSETLRQAIVEGAVGMVKMALDKLQADGVVTLSDNDRVTLATNLMTVLVSESETQPVLSMSREGH